MTGVAAKRLESVDWGDIFAAKNAKRDPRKFSVGEFAGYYLLLDSWGHDFILATISEGRTISEIAMAHGIPPIVMLRYIRERIPAPHIKDAFIAAAASYAAKAEASLDMVDLDNSKNVIAAVNLAKARAELYLHMAERLSPQDFGPPMPVPMAPAPVSLTINLDREQPPPIVPPKYVLPVHPVRIIDVDDEDQKEFSPPN